MTSALVEARDLTRVFDVSRPWLNRVIEGGERTYLKAVDGVSFSIGRRETLALVGESGSGKSTVARMVVGLLEPSAGSVTIDGIDMWAPTRRRERQRLRRRLQMIFQDPFASLNPRWRVKRIVADPIRAFGLAKDRREIEHRVAELLTLVGLDPADGAKYPHEFSGGQRQRICIARALSSTPEFLVCDEPTSALDVSVQAQILNLMRDLQDRFQLSYLFISHNLAVVRHMATRIGVMYLGRIVELAPAAELFERPRHPYTRMLLDALPDLAMTGRAAPADRGRDPQPHRPAARLRLPPPLPPRLRALPPRRAGSGGAARARGGVPCGRGGADLGGPTPWGTAHSVRRPEEAMVPEPDLDAEDSGESRRLRGGWLTLENRGHPHLRPHAAVQESLDRGQGDDDETAQGNLQLHLAAGPQLPQQLIDALLGQPKPSVST